MRKGEATRKHILDVAADRTSIRGFAAVSLQDLADAAGLSKSGVVRHFVDKEALTRALVDDLLARFRRIVWEPAAALPAGRKRLECVFSGWLAWVEGEHVSGGCPITAACIEFDDQPGPIRDRLRSGQAAWMRVVEDEFRAIGWQREEAALRAFCLQGIVLSYSHALRLLDDPDARRKAEAAFARLLAAEAEQR
ncbi:TetR/AcrR family transcriptional regulator [Chelativorans intermedius]|uniref:TetR/AcrR family transcriptional regulator n=1 Tax=Chelativorans intermedius TaxID=515947 RepID=A0ABV6D4I6_9HYPH|nr:TetR/AcrR family transcriptional regulator [Chelativorans intermedius]MCT8997546.1 TetR/AcrR family transcriptional regulator [Chelativorans intermedius]